MPTFELGLLGWKTLIDHGVYVNLAAFVAVPGGGCLLRCSVCAAHSLEEMEQVVGAFNAVRDLLDQSQAPDSEVSANLPAS